MLHVNYIAIKLEKECSQTFQSFIKSINQQLKMRGLTLQHKLSLSSFILVFLNPHPRICLLILEGEEGKEREKKTWM